MIGDFPPCAACGATFGHDPDCAPRARAKAALLEREVAQLRDEATARADYILRTIDRATRLERERDEAKRDLDEARATIARVEALAAEWEAERTTVVAAMAPTLRHVLRGPAHRFYREGPA